MTARRCALVVTLVAATGFALVAATWVPWHPVPGGAPGALPPGSVFTAEEIRRGEDYASWARLWSLLSLLISLVVTSVLGFSPWGARLMARLPGRWWVKVVLGVLVISLLGRLATLPCSVMLQRHRLANGLSTQSWVGYARDVATSEAVAVVTTSLGLLVLLGVARRWTRAWPAIAAGLVAGLVVLGSFVYPLVVEPLFNDFTPLADADLRSAIFALADQEGVRIDDVLVADASRRTTTLNAYVSGFGDTRRVVVYDNLVESLPRDEALSVIAHELAHARHGDVVVGTALGPWAAPPESACWVCCSRAARDGDPARWSTLGSCPSCWHSVSGRPWPPVPCRAASAGRSRRAPTWTHSGRPTTPMPSSRCSGRSPCDHWPTRPRPRGCSGGGGVIRRRWSGSRSLAS